MVVSVPSLIFHATYNDTDVLERSYSFVNPVRVRVPVPLSPAIQKTSRLPAVGVAPRVQARVVELDPELPEVDWTTEYAIHSHS
jgi:hypothetical protein